MRESSVSPTTRSRIGTLYTALQPLVYRVLEDVHLKTGRKMGVSQALRSMDEQLQVYKQGRELIDGIWKITDSAKIVTNAKPGLSWHNYGLAFDCAWTGKDPYLKNETYKDQNELWKIYAAVGRSYGFRAGADFRLVNGVRDLPHLELTFGLSLDQALELYQHGGLLAVWTYIDGLIAVV